MAVIVGVCGLAIAALAAVGWVVAIADSAPNLSQLKPKNPHPLTRIYTSDGTLLGYVHSNTIYSQVASNQIPNRLKEATVAIEDRRFYHHGALDYQGILRAGIKDIFGGGSSLQGASTLTMQLVDNMYLNQTKYSADHNLKYKIVQAKLAEQLEGRHSKSWILDSYLSHVPYGTVDGETALGVGAASQMFFDKPVWELSLAQEALLAGLPQAPSEYNPFLFQGPARMRRQQVLQAMVASHYINQRQASAAEKEPLGVQKSPAYAVRKEPYVFDYVEQQLNRKLCPNTPTYCPGVANGGLKVYTTINLHTQQLARNALLSHEGGPVLDNQPAAALASVDPSNGHILAIASTASYDQTNFDYPVQAHRQPGSSFKVFALMTLIHDFHGDPSQTYYTSQFLPAGWLPADPTWSVHTAEETYQGSINITKATVVSDNTVFAQLAVDIGPAKMDAMAHAMGITSSLNDLPAEVIGGLKEGVTPLEMADAYATLANGGWHIPTTIISKIVFPDGSSQSFADPPKKQVFSYGEAYAAIQVLKQVITSGTGTAAGYGCPAAGKTGTAENLANAWFVGFSPKLSTGVWVGYPQGNVPMANGFGGSLAAPIWHDFMQSASNGYCGDWAPPAVPFQGTAFFGAHSDTGNPNVGANTTGTVGTSGGFGTTYNNATTYQSSPPQPQPTTTGGGGGGGTANGGGATGQTTPSGGSGTGGGTANGGLATGQTTPSHGSGTRGGKHH